MQRFFTSIWVFILIVFAALLILPASHSLFISTTKEHPFVMGFFKFAILSTMGEFLAARIVFGRWQMIAGIIPKMVIWGILGVIIVLMFSLYSEGVDAAINKGLLWAGSASNIADTPSPFISKLLKAFYISAIMNLTFAPIFMATHRITDTIIENRLKKVNLTLSNAVSSINWSEFIRFIVGKTIPFFWIPAHTITFLLPDSYKVLFAASLSIVLGLILSFAKLQSSTNNY